MGFKQTLNALRETNGKAATEAALGSAAENARESIQFEVFIARVDPFVAPLFERFVAEAKGEGFYARNHFEKQRWMCWWNCTFIPAVNEEPYTGMVAGLVNQAAALVRLSSNGSIALEWHIPGGDYSSFFKYEERNRKLALEELTPQVLDQWLDEFTKRIFAYREMRDKTR